MAEFRVKGWRNTVLILTEGLQTKGVQGLISIRSEELEPYCNMSQLGEHLAATSAHLLSFPGGEGPCLSEAVLQVW